VAVFALLTLLYNIINSAFGLVALESEVEPSALVQAAGFDSSTELTGLSKDDLVVVLQANVNNNVGRRLERDQRFYEDRLVFETQEKWDEVCARQEDRPDGCTGGVRDADNVYAVIVEQIVQPQARETWSLVDTVFSRSEIEERVASEYPDADLVFRSWLSMDFVTSPQSPQAETAGVRTAILGSLWIVLVTILFSFPVGVAAAIYLEEYARDTRLNRLIQTNINNLAGVPSIIYGMLGLAIFVRVFEAFTSGAIFGGSEAGVTANGRTVVSAGLTLGLLILPIIIINAQEAIKAVPQSLRAAGLALGATRWQTIRAHVLPNAIPGILTGAILAVARALGETAPLVVVGASTFITTDPSGPFAKFTALPIQIFQWTSRPQDEFRNIAAAAIIVLLLLLLTLNATAIILRNRYARRV
jgi:phosphate transport system permease protein